MKIKLIERNKSLCEDELKSFESLSIGTYCDNFKFKNVSDILKSIIQINNKNNNGNNTIEKFSKSLNQDLFSNETNRYIDVINQKIFDKENGKLKLITLKNVQKFDILRRFTITMFNKDPIISLMNKKINKEKISGFIKKIEQIRLKNSNFVINENDKEYLKEVKKNIDNIKEKIINQIVNIEGELKDLVMLRDVIISKIKANKIK